MSANVTQTSYVKLSERTKTKGMTRTDEASASKNNLGNFCMAACRKAVLTLPQEGREYLGSSERRSDETNRLALGFIIK
jgi:hypothetical protein